MADKPVSRRPWQETAAKAEATANTDNVKLDDRYMYTVTGPGGDITQVDVLGIPKADMIMGYYETETVTP